MTPSPRSQDHTCGGLSLSLAGGQGKHAPIPTPRVAQDGQTMHGQSEKPAPFTPFAAHVSRAVTTAPVRRDRRMPSPGVSSLDLPGGRLAHPAFREAGSASPACAIPLPVAPRFQPCLAVSGEDTRPPSPLPSPARPAAQSVRAGEASRPCVSSILLLTGVPVRRLRSLNNHGAAGRCDPRRRSIGPP